MAHHVPGPHILSAIAGTTQAPSSPDEQSGEKWASSKGIPLRSDPVVQNYLKSREDLIQSEEKQRSDLKFREGLSPIARKACSIVKSLRSKEEQTIWGVDPETRSTNQKTEDGHSLYPGMMFALAQKRIQKSKLYGIIRKMPKGSLLHCHIEAMVNFQWLFQHLLTVPGMHVSSTCPIISPQDEKIATVNVTHLKKDQTGADSICDPKYVPGTWVPIISVAKTWTNGPQAFVDFLVSKCSISVEDSLNHREGPNAIWVKFQNCFTILSPVVYYEPIYRAHLAQFFSELAKDNIRYVEIRQPSIMQFTLEGEEQPLDPHDGWVASFRIIQEEVKKFKATTSGKNFWGVKIIWNTLRIFPDKDIYDSMAGAIDLKQKFPDMIAGFDLVGQEDLGKSLVEVLPLLLWFKDACAKAKVTIPLLLHAGETNQSGGPTDLNLFDAVLLGSRRIGHGYSSFKHPLLMDMMRDRQIMVEMCPISNEVLRLNTSTYGHPLSALLAHGVPCAVSNDDPGVLGVNNPGLSFDYFQAIQGAESLGLEGLGALAENSIRYSVFEDEDDKTWLVNVNDDGHSKAEGIKAQRLREWRHDWEKFCRDVVLEAHAENDEERDEQVRELKVDLQAMTEDRDWYKNAYEGMKNK